MWDTYELITLKLVVQTDTESSKFKNRIMRFYCELNAIE